MGMYVLYMCIHEWMYVCECFDSKMKCCLLNIDNTIFRKILEDYNTKTNARRKAYTGRSTLLNTYSRHSNLVITDRPTFFSSWSSFWLLQLLIWLVSVVLDPSVSAPDMDSSISLCFSSRESCLSTGLPEVLSLWLDCSRSEMRRTRNPFCSMISLKAKKNGKKEWDKMNICYTDVSQHSFLKFFSYIQWT